MVNDFEQAQADFLEDMRTLKAKYEEDARPHIEKLEGIKREAKAMVDEAQREYWAAAREQNARYRLLIGESSKRRMEQAEHPQDIAEAGNSIGALLGGPCNDNFNFNEDIGRGHFNACKKRREQQEQWERETQARGLNIIWL